MRQNCDLIKREKRKSEELSRGGWMDRAINAHGIELLRQMKVVVLCVPDVESLLDYGLRWQAALETRCLKDEISGIMKDICVYFRFLVLSLLDYVSVFMSFVVYVHLVPSGLFQNFVSVTKLCLYISVCYSKAAISQQTNNASES